MGDQPTLQEVAETGSSQTDCSLNDWIKLNVGGTVFQTTRSTLVLRDPESMLGRMFRAVETSEAVVAEFVHNRRNVDERSLMNSTQDGDGAVLIDRSARYFEPVLDYLRHGRLVVGNDLCLEGVEEEAKFFGLGGLQLLVRGRMQERQSPGGPIGRSQVVAALLRTPYNQLDQLRFQGVNFEGCDLSNFDLRNANFKYANLNRANLTNCDLSHACFDRASLVEATLNGAKLFGVKFSCANLEKAQMTSCNFEDPHQNPTVLEGTNLRGANLEGSQMARVNLRVACLKNACLRNCDLRSAVLAGADLENCDLSGSDLQEANLRGANFTNATFDHILNPLRMSQAVP